MWFHSRVPGPDKRIIILHAVVRTYEFVLFVYTCCFFTVALCCYTAVPAAVALLLFAIVCRITKFVALIHSICFFSVCSYAIYF